MQLGRDRVSTAGVATRLHTCTAAWAATVQLLLLLSAGRSSSSSILKCLDVSPGAPPAACWLFIFQTRTKDQLEARELLLRGLCLVAKPELMALKQWYDWDTSLLMF